jgi:hypothetical protein
MLTCAVPTISITRMTTAPSRAQLPCQARQLNSIPINHLLLCHILHAISTPRLVQQGWSPGRMVPDSDVRDPDQPARR